MIMTPESKEALITCLATVLRAGDNDLAQPIQNLITGSPQQFQQPALAAAPSFIQPPTRTLPPPGDDFAEAPEQQTSCTAIAQCLETGFVPYLKQQGFQQFEIAEAYSWVEQNINLVPADKTPLDRDRPRYKNTVYNAIVKLVEKGVFISMGSRTGKYMLGDD